MKKMRYLLLCALSVFAMFSLTACGSELEAKDYVKVTYEGFDGYGTATASVDAEKLVKEIMGEEDFEDSSYSTKKEKKELMEIAEEKIDVELDLDDEEMNTLSNGDKIKVELKISERNAEKLGVTFANTEFEVEVKGLEKAKEIDIFTEEYITCTFEGTSPCIDLDIDTHNYELEAPLYNISYSADKSDNLKNGEVVTVTATYDEEEMLQAGYKVISNTKEYTATCTEEYVTSASQISDTDHAALQKKALAVIRQEESSCNVKKTSWEFVGNYVLYDDPEGNYYYENRIYYVFKGKLVPKNKEYKKKTVYVAAYFNSPVLTTSGAIFGDWNANASLAYEWGYGYQTDNWSTFDCFLTEQDLFSNLVTDEYSYDYHEVTGSLKDIEPAAPASGSAVTVE